MNPRKPYSIFSQSALQANKDMGKVLISPCAFDDPYYDVWDVSRAKVFTPEQENLNKKLTFL